jgi:tetratricopeptide (TPR) repeat protein
VVKGQDDYDWADAERCFRRAVAREPLSPHLRQWYGTFFLFSVGRVTEALLQLDRVIEEDPLCQMWRMMRANLLAGLGRLDDAIDESRKSVELDPAFWLGWMDLGVLLAIRRQHDEAMGCAERAMAAAPWSPYSRGLMAATLANSGQAEEAEALRVTLRGDSYGGPLGLAIYSLARGDNETAADWVVKTVEQRFPASIPRLVRQFEPLLRLTTAWPRVLQAAKLA